MTTPEVLFRIDMILDRLILGTEGKHLEWEWGTSSIDGRDMADLSAESTSFIIRGDGTGGGKPVDFEVYDSGGFPIAQLGTRNTEYPEEIRRKVAKLWDTIMASRSKRTARLLDQAIRDIDSIPPF
ncbi:MAG: hypothetical protein ACRDTE_14890 [Pseudonocardiaceae bacterium]